MNRDPIMNTKSAVAKYKTKFNILLIFVLFLSFTNIYLNIISRKSQNDYSQINNKRKTIY